MNTPNENDSPFLLMAGLAGGTPVRRIHTQWKPNNSTLNVVSYGLPDKRLAVHLARDGRTCLSVDVRELEQYSMSEAIVQAKTILDQL